MATILEQSKQQILLIACLYGCAATPAAAQTVAAILPPITAPSIGAWYEIHNVSGNGYPGAEAVCRARTPTLPVRFIAYNAPNDPYSGITGTCQAETMPGFWSDTAYPAYYQHCPAGYGVPPELSVTFSYPNAGPLTCNRIGAFNRCPDAQAGEAPYTLDSSGLTCSRPDPETYTIDLTSSASTIEPAGLPWNTTPTNSALLAKVINQNREAKSGIEVKLSISVEQGSGGHLHHPDRELGFLLNAAGSANCRTAGNPLTPCVSGFTGPDGTTGFIYAASQLSGTYTITAICDKCINAPTSTITVQLDKLETISASPGNCYTLQDNNGVIGAISGQHTDNHWVRRGVSQRLEEFACGYQRQVQNNKQVLDKRLFINDASLVWGGKFEPHDSHRFGWSIDVRAESAARKMGEVPANLFAGLVKRKQPLRGSKIDVQVHCTKPNGSLGMAYRGNPKACDKYPNNRHLHVDFK